MTTPDLRPIGALTPAILATASHWCLLYDGNAAVYQSSVLDIDADGLCTRVRCSTDLWPVGSCIRIGFIDARCYPCTLHPDGRVVPEPWPMAEGEEIIDALEGIDPAQYDVMLSSATNTWTVYEGRMGFLSCGYRPGFHPSPRKGGRWVWEADRC